MTKGLSLLLFCKTFSKVLELKMQKIWACFLSSLRLNVNFFVYILLLLMPWSLVVYFWQNGAVCEIRFQLIQRGDVLPTIYVITPTYARPVQKADLTRLSNTLLHVRNLHWIVVEDSNEMSSLVRRFLEKTGLPYTHLNVPSPMSRQNSKGTLQRNLGLTWLRKTFDVNNKQPPGVVYFADDDNTYSLQVFEEMRWTKRVSVWPVAFAGGLWYEAPKVNKLGKVYGWDVKYDPGRTFAIDMAGFAINLHLILSKPQAFFDLNIAGGYEGTLLRELVTLEELEPKAAKCTQILVWHTRTSAPKSSRENGRKYSEKNMEV